MQNQLFINGEFISAQSGETFATINPATEEKLADVASAGLADVDAAVRAARAQMEPGSDWQKMKPRDRGKILWKIADMLAAKADEIGHIETLEMLSTSAYGDSRCFARIRYGVLRRITVGVTPKITPVSSSAGFPS